MKNQLERLQAELWDREGKTRYQRGVIAVGRYVYVIARDLADGQLNMRAMSLVYTTLLAMVPMLALGFSLFKALGVHNMLEPVLLQFLGPLGAQAEELTRNIIGFVENIKVGVLGSLGVALLFYAAVSMIRKIENSFNFIWRIDRVRPMSQRVGEYLAVLIVGPVLVFSALGITASVLNSSVIARLSQLEPLGTTISILASLVPYLLIIAAFTFVYSFIPNTKVRFKAALAGGALAGFGWQYASVLFAQVVAATASYSAIYSGFAIVILLLIWFYIGWLILLVGCQLSYYVQHPEHVVLVKKTPLLSGRSAEQLGLAILLLTGRRFVAGEPPLAEDEITRTLGTHSDHVTRVIEILLHHGLLAEVVGARTSRPALLPGRDLDSITLGEAWQKIRRGLDAPRTATREEAGRGGDVLDEMEQHFLKNKGAKTLRQWLAAG